MIRLTTILAIPAALVLLACGAPSQHEILKQADGLETKQELEAAIGAPDSVERVGPLEKWTYNASDGKVEFVITGDAIRTQATGDRDDEKAD